MRHPVLSLAFASCLSLAAQGALAQCPPEGDARQPLARTLNVFKNRDPGPQPDQLDANVSLTALLNPGNDLARWNRGAGAAVEGVVVGVKVGGVETANCHATAPEDRDTHIELALSSDAAEIQRVIVEVTPRWRHALAQQGVDWSTQGLMSLVGHRVRVTGWLLDDLEHVNEAQNSNPGGARDWRATVWEIHPISAIAIVDGEPATNMALMRVPLPNVMKAKVPLIYSEAGDEEPTKVARAPVGHRRATHRRRRHHRKPD